MRILTPLAAVPLVIGRGGEIVRGLCSSFGVNIKIQDRVEGLGERIIDVRGGGDPEILDAVMALAEIINKEVNPAEYASVLYPYHSGNYRVPGPGQGMGAGDYSGAATETKAHHYQTHQHPHTQQQQQQQPRSAQAPSIEVLSHPCRIGFLVPEKCRLTLKECAAIEQQLEGVKIALSPKDEFDCNVDIEGPLATVQAAHILIIKLVTDRLLQDQNLVLAR